MRHNENGLSLLTGLEAPLPDQISNLFIEDLIRLFELEPFIDVEPVEALKPGFHRFRGTHETARARKEHPC
ncbi:MAG TPA: hypothetical protein VHI13_13930 [Candidatus Kapabacteria bacterium]|nr:hypothetical protein [Candidatus Kapabacteria bacterium]